MSYPSPPKTYSFLESLKEGKQGEKELDNFFRKWYAIQVASTKQEREGIDRIFTPLQGVKTLKTVQYKTDFQAQKTGNVYIETLSCSDSRAGGSIAGWSYTSLAEWLVYYIFPCKILCIRFMALRASLSNLTEYYPEIKVNSDYCGNSYFGKGLLVPISELEQISKTIFDNPRGNDMRTPSKKLSKPHKVQQSQYSNVQLNLFPEPPAVKHNPTLNNHPDTPPRPTLKKTELKASPVPVFNPNSEPLGWEPTVGMRIYVPTDNKYAEVIGFSNNPDRSTDEGKCTKLSGLRIRYEDGTEDSIYCCQGVPVSQLSQSELQE